MTDTEKTPFWKTKTMAEMSQSEWESLCDGCGKCCCIRLEDEDNGDIYITDVTCRLFDTHNCRCGDYANRSKLVPDCVTLTPDNVTALNWMPKTCAYRLVANGEDLPKWHHLVSGSEESIHDAGMSVQDAVISEDFVQEDDHIHRIVIWPGEPDIP
jgi:uncharacterized cysteine cluster protein YcgN (CxxCxxCC family)